MMVNRMGLYQRWLTRLRYAAPQTHLKIFMIACAFTLFLIVITYIQLTAIPKLPLVIVEEHHEALPYWLAGAEENDYPKSGLTLIHIDGHSDESTPEYLENFPLFRWPTNDEELSLLMQKNDIFIQAAVMSGLISRVIFIFPSWNKDEEPDYYKDTVSLGYFMHKEHGASAPEPYFCECHSVMQEGNGCMFINFSANADVMQNIPEEKCNIKASYISEHVVDDIAAQKILSGLWIKKNESYILDIDEDYFGCESGATPLVKSGITWQVVSIIDNKLNVILCPKSIHHEEEADTMLKQTIETLMEMCFEGKSNACTNDFTKVYKVTLEIVKQYFMDHPSMFCAKNDLQIKTEWKDVIFVLNHMKKKHLYMLLQTGFCLNTSPASYGFFQGRGHIEICHGANTPNETVVFLHSPTQKEITNRMSEVQRLISHFPHVPELVTLCRSIRDGYTPRQHSMMIEWGITRALATVFSNRNLDVTYDPNLLGGRRGWYGRYGGYPPPDQKGRVQI